eukprot:scaffold29974_cov60-Cyclotella_meneghiniana.AAC.3
MQCKLGAISIITSLTCAQSSPTRRRKSRRRQLEPVSTRLHANTKETLRERWVDILQSTYDESSAIRLETRREEEHYYSAELLADKLLNGIDEDRILLRSERVNSANEFTSKLWESIAIGSTGFLALFPLTIIVLELLPPSFFSSSVRFLVNKLTSIHSSITPHLFPTIQAINASVKDQLIQAQSIITSLPYFLKHIRRVRLMPLVIKVLRKCVVLEAWRHIWVRVYKISKRVWKGTRVGSVKVYTKFVPAWIRRGINSMFKSAVQSQIHGVVGSAVGDIYVSILGDGLGSGINEIPVDESIEGVMETSFDLDVAAGEQMVGVVESAVENIAESSITSAIAEDAMESLTEGLTSAVEESVDNAVDIISESVGGFIEECITE